MIETQHKAWAHWIFKRYLRRLTAKHFSALHRVGDTLKINSDEPLIILPNHSTWWDGFFVYMLNERLWKRRLYLMMLQEQLGRFRFFSKVGAFGIDRTSTAEVKKALRYCVDKVQQENSMLCLFPQGELKPYNERPVSYGRGIEFILKRVPQARVLLLGISAEFLLEQRPEVFFTLRETNARSAAELAEQHTGLLEQLDRDIAGGKTMETFFHGKKSLSA